MAIRMTESIDNSDNYSVIRNVVIESERNLGAKFKEMNKDTLSKRISVRNFPLFRNYYPNILLLWYAELRTIVFVPLEMAKTGADRLLEHHKTVELSYRSRIISIFNYKAEWISSFSQFFSSLSFWFWETCLSCSLLQICTGYNMPKWWGGEGQM